MLTIYKIVTNLIYFFLWPYLFVKTRREPEEWRQRRCLDSGCHPLFQLPAQPSPAAARLWFHASSVGEVRVLERLVRAVLRARPDVQVHISTYTRAGYALAHDLFPAAQAVFYFPLDCHFPLRRLFARFRPDGVIIVETEIWPYLLDFCRRRQVPVILANGRLTERSTRQYRIFRSGLRPLFSVYRRFVMQSKADSERIIAIGADPTRVVELGNIKHDTNGPVDREAKRRDVRRFLRLPDDRLFFVAASTRPGEEKIICEAVKENSSFPGRMTVMVAPRHLERLDEVAALLNDCQIEFTRYTTLEAGAMLSTPVVLMDKIGVLADLFYGADLAFVGGTLVDLGGHNIMEPVLAGTPVLFGPSVHNVREAADRIIAADQGMMVSTGDDLARVLEEFAAGRLHFKTMQAGKPSVADQTAHIIVTELGL